MLYVEVTTMRNLLPPDWKVPTDDRKSKVGGVKSTAWTKIWNEKQSQIYDDVMNKSRIVEEFLTLVKIASPTGNERKLADYLKNLLTNLGLTVTEDKTGETFGGNTGNVIAYLSSTKENTPTLLLSAHMDCVSPCENVKPQRKNGIISSDGIKHDSLYLTKPLVM